MFRDSSSPAWNGVRERRPALPRTLEKNRQQRQEAAQPEPERYYYPELALSRELQRYTYELCKEYTVDYELLLADDVA